jgi:hypothetical protein
MDPHPPLIRHVRHEDFFALLHGGAADLERFGQALDALLAEMGPPHHHHVLFDLRGAAAGPLPEVVLIQAVEEVRRRGIGAANRLAILADTDDWRRWERIQSAEGIAAVQGLRIRGFVAYDEALDWLSDPDPGA